MFMYIYSLAEINPTSDSFFIPLIIVLILMIIFLIVAITISRIVSTNRGHNRIDSNVRIYTYNYAKNTFTCFDKLNIRNVKEYSEIDFYSQFTASDKYRLQEWLKNLSQNKNVSDYIQCDIRIKKKSKNVPSFIALTSINREKNTIHFESHLLPFSNYQSSNPKKKNKKFLLDKFEKCVDFMEKNKDKESIGATFYINLYLPENKKNDKGLLDLAILSNPIKETLTSYLNTYRRMICIDENTFMIIDTKVISKAMALELATSFQTALRQCINHTIDSTSVRFAIGLSTGFFYEDLDSAKEQSSMMAEAITKGDYDREILFYDPYFFIKEKKRKSDLEDVKMLIKNSTYRLYFNPTIDVRSFTQSFYFTNVVPHGTEIKHFSEILQMSTNYKNGKLQLISSLIEKITMIAKQKEGNKTFSLPIIYSAIPELLKARPHNLKDDILFILVLKESDLIAYIDDLRNVISTLKDLKKRGYYLGLDIANPTSLLPSKILNLFSYIFISSTFTTIDNPMNTLKLIENDYCSLAKIPLVYYGFKDTNNIGLCAHYSGVIFQSSKIASASSILEDISEDKINMLKEELQENIER